MQNLGDIMNVNVLAIDYRGFGNSEGSPSEEGLAKDARAAWDWVVSHGVPAEQIVLLGHSLGTGVATRLARDLSKEGIHPKGLILQAPYVSIPDVAFEFRVFQALPLLAPVAYVPALHEYLKSHIIDRFNSLSHVPHLTCPLLIIHGVKDREIPSHHSRLLFRSAVKAHANAVGLHIHGVSVKSKKDGVEVEYTTTAAEMSFAKVGGKWLDSCEETQGNWGLEGRRWISVRGESGLKEGDGVPVGPSKVMLLELHHAHHNNVQSHDLTYESIETFLELSP
ncbi:hypothetical protein HDV05_003042 [Chytridiales sp. JEL 0842]|nr:hypothetical protein HDV05_003042 [Chytridiales sp. JEL 0842]